MFFKSSFSSIFLEKLIKLKFREGFESTFLSLLKKMDVLTEDTFQK